MTQAADEDLRDGAARALTSRLLSRASRDSTLALAKGLAASAARELGTADMRAALALLEPLLPSALREAMQNPEVGMREAGSILGMSHESLRQWIAGGACPIPHTRVDRATRFRREDVEAFVSDGAEPAPAHALIVAALKRALADAPPAGPRPWVSATELATRLGLATDRALYYQLKRGTLPLRPVRLGRRLLFRRADVEEFFRDTNTSKEP
jgi:predicted DNA-binding transcriptional regulator AlpA